MAKIVLPSGGWVEYREELTAGDRFAVQDSVTLRIENGANVASLGMQNHLRNALLKQIITSWSFGNTPSDHPNADPNLAIGNAMSLKDYNALSKAVDPLLREVQGLDETEEDPKASQTS